MGANRTGKDQRMSSRDEEDWVGEPPEGRHSRDRANPDFWATNRPLVVAVFWAMLFVLAIVVLVLAL
jgi:hypothetical protein